MHIKLSLQQDPMKAKSMVKCFDSHLLYVLLKGSNDGKNKVFFFIDFNGILEFLTAWTMIKNVDESSCTQRTLLQRVCVDRVMDNCTKTRV